MLALLCLQPGARGESQNPAPPAAPVNTAPAAATHPADAPAAAAPAESGAAAGEAKPDAVARQAPGPTEAAKPREIQRPFKVGAELYTGGSNMPGHRFLDAGLWAGSGPEFPSVGYARWDDGRGHAAKTAIGFGSVFHGKDKIFDQPAEAWYQFPAGKTSVTVGQYWVPFAAQEWEYENKPGAMLQWSRGPWGLSLSANQNLHTGRPNGYMRLSHALGENNAIGLSVGGGKGMSFNSAHNRGWGFDATYGYRGVRFSTELLQMQAPGSRNFRFLWTKLGYEKLGPWKPYVSWYNWDDRAGQLGHFQSTVLGMAYKVNSNLAIEGAVANTLRKNVGWMQMHWTWEK